MTINYNPRVVTDGLVLHLDASNSRSLSNTNVNMFSSPEDFSNVAWNTRWGGAGTVTTNVDIAPDGTLTADSFLATIGTSGVGHSVTVTAGITYTFSIHVKTSVGATLVSRTINDGGAGVNSQTISAPNTNNQWIRYSLTWTETVTGTRFVGIFTAINTVFTIWGAQLEQATTASAYYSINSGQRSITWADISGNGYNATLINSPLYSQDNGGSLMFSGTQYATVTNPLITQPTLLQEWTVSAWLKVDDTSGQNLLNLNNGLYPSYGTNNSLLYLNGGADDYYTYGGDIGNTGWSYVTFRFKNSTGYRTIYKNAINISTGGPNNTSRPSGNPNTLTIAGNLRGNLSKLEIYNRVLSDTEVQQNFNAVRGRYGV